MSDERQFTDKERTIFSLLGAIRFDAEAVANTLRSRPLSNLEAHALANLIEGKHPEGLRLQMTGQGRNWTPISEGAARYDRCIAIGKMMADLQAEGLSWEQATLDTADHFGVSEATVARNAAHFRFIQDTD